MTEIINQWLIDIIDLTMAVLPTTPPALKLSVAVAKMALDFPYAPWYLVGKFIQDASVVFGAVATLKAWKLVWP